MVGCRVDLLFQEVIHIRVFLWMAVDTVVREKGGHVDIKVFFVFSFGIHFAET